jgi:tRNA(adenine34) deaminase
MEDINKQHERFMEMALMEAEKAAHVGEVPVGVIVVANGRIIARAHNLTQRLNDVTAHAEMQAITAAADYLGGKYLTGCTMYVTLEPCVMCAGALAWSQIDKIVFGASDTKRGFSMLEKEVLHKKTKVVSGVKAAEAAMLLKEFFKLKRK